MLVFIDKACPDDEDELKVHILIYPFVPVSTPVKHRKREIFDKNRFPQHNNIKVTLLQGRI